VEIAGKRHLAILPLGKNLNPSQNSTATLITTRVSQNLGKYKACCCDERRESVETVRTGMVCTTYSGKSLVAICENLGKKGAAWPTSSAG
jgi:hypothetical protein